MNSYASWPGCCSVLGVRLSILKRYMCKWATFQLDKSPTAMIVAIVANCSPTPNLRKSRNSYFPGSITIRFVWYEIGVRNDAELATINTRTASRRSSPADHHEMVAQIAGYLSFCRLGWPNLGLSAMRTHRRLSWKGLRRLGRATMQRHYSRQQTQQCRR